MNRGALHTAALLVLALCSAASAAGAAPKRGPKPRRPRPPKVQPQEAPKDAPAPNAAHAPTEAATSVEVTVAEIAGTKAYLRPGASAGVRRGSKVVFDRHEYEVVLATASYAIVDLDRHPLREEQKGRATVTEEREEQAAPLKRPRPMAAFDGVWPPADAPADAQRPRPVPLGETARDRRFDVRFTTVAGAVLPLGSRGRFLGRGELVARVHAEPFSAPVAFDLDASLQQWIGPGVDARAGSQARPLVRVRELLVGYGAAPGFYGGIGRMRYAASTLGALDGARVRTGLGAGFSVGAFGGMLPNPLSAAPSLAAARFGVEATYSAPEAGARPEAALVAHGSTFDGRLDERRLSGVFALFPGSSRFGGHFELSSFESGNPWNAAPLELTAGGVDASVRSGAFEVGGAVRPAAAGALALARLVPPHLVVLPPGRAAARGDSWSGALRRARQHARARRGGRARAARPPRVRRRRHRHP